MLMRIWDIIVPVLARTGSTNYHRASIAKTTEPHTPITQGYGELGMNARHATQTSSAHKKTSIESDRPDSAIQQYKHRWSGWRFGIINFGICASIVFLINLIVTIWASVAHRETEHVLHEGDCGRIKTANSGVHIIINVLSTILLSGSNYCMQCLSAPSKQEIDKAHGKREWLDIGVPSLRNLTRISRSRLILWLLLAVSSLPLHLLYNSAVYASVSANSYNGYVVTQAFIDDPICQNCTNSTLPSEADSPVLFSLWAKSRNGSLDRLDPVECIDAYGTPIQSFRRSLFVVIADNNVGPGTLDSEYPRFRWTTNKNILQGWTSDAGEGLRHYTNQGDPMIGWICSALHGKPDYEPCINYLGEIRSSQPWKIGMNCYDGPDGYCERHRWPVDYCLSERAESRCRLHFSPLIAIIVTALNLLKALLMFYVLHSLKGNPLMTMGDAVASFLNERDVTTKYLGLLSIRDARKGYNASATTWQNPRWRWKDATSKVRRVTTLLLFAVAIATVTALLIWGVRSTNRLFSTSTINALSIGFGAVDPRTLISSGAMPTNMVLLAIVANLPQVILSFLYFAYNSLLTAMLMGYEWTSSAHKRKGLRVSQKPTGAQRSTYFLQLPYRFGVPLVILSGALHWLVSQSIFVVSLDVYDAHGEPVPEMYTGWEWDMVTRTVGYSPIAMLSVIILGLLMIAAIVGLGYIPYKPGMPLAGSCSLAISAACHPEKGAGLDNDALSKQKLQWGVCSTGVDGVGHCAFSSEDVGILVKGRMYT